jgi:perosamine synthetase
MIGVGIVGTGLIAHEHAAAIAMTGRLKLLAAADVAPGRLAQFADDFGVAARHQEDAALIADPQVDLVVVATPPYSHEALVVAALEQGKYVLCEKPLAHSLASARRIVEAEARHPGQLSVGYQLRYHAPFRRLSWLAREGWLGEIRSAIVERHGYIPHSEHGATGWWGVWGVAGGGALVTQMIHELDLLIQIMGMPRSVKAVADTRFTGIESEDYLEATLTYARGCRAICVASVNSGTQGGGFVIEGEKGNAWLSGRLDLFDEARQAEALKAANAAAPFPAASGNDPLGRLMRRLGAGPRPATPPRVPFYLDIADAIGRGAPLPIPAPDAMASLELCMAAYESAITGAEIELPLGPANKVYEGVRRENYEARKCDRNAPGLFILPSLSPRPPATFAGRLRETLKDGLSAVGLEPPVIKAMIRRPAPVHGGPRTRIRSWPRRRTFGKAEKRAIIRLMGREMRHGDAIRYDGPEERAYCEAFAKYLGGGYANAVNAGTNAVYVALKALDLEPGSEVIVAPVTDAGGTMPVAVMNCTPVVADAAPGSILVSVDQIRAVLTERTSAIVVAHIAGHAVDLDPILELAAERGIPVVEDCAQAHGTLYKGRMVGTFGAIAAFSTMFLKNHATGGQGGVVFTRDPRLFVRARQVADRGKPFGVLKPTGNVIASLNFNQDEISMAIGRVQLHKLPAQVAARRAFAAMVDQGLQGIEQVSLIGDPPYSRSSYHFLMFQLDVGRLGCTVEQFGQGLAEDGIGGVGPYEVYPTDNPWYRDAAVFGASGMPWSLRPEAPAPRRFDLPNARESTRRLLRVDLYEGMGPTAARDLVKALRKAVRWYGGRA